VAKSASISDDSTGSSILGADRTELLARSTAVHEWEGKRPDGGSRTARPARGLTYWEWWPTGKMAPSFSHVRPRGRRPWCWAVPV